MYFARINVGRLLEARISSPFELPDLNAFQELVRGAVASAPYPTIVFFCDMRGASVFTQDVAAGLLALMRHDNPRLERSGLLLARGAVFTLQMERLVRNAGNPNRRTFVDPNECAAWLSEVLDLHERAQLKRFLGA